MQLKQGGRMGLCCGVPAAEIQDAAKAPEKKPIAEAEGRENEPARSSRGSSNSKSKSCGEGTTANETAPDKVLLTVQSGESLDEDMVTVISGTEAPGASTSLPSVTALRRLSSGSQSPGKAFATSAEIPWFSVFQSISEEQFLRSKGEMFKVRNSGYAKSGEKINSKGALYDCIGADAVAAKGGKIAEVISNWDCQFPRKTGYREAWGIPEILVVNQQIPFTSGGMFSKHPEDDHGFNVINYYALSDDSMKSLQGGEWTVALRHWKKLLDLGKSDKKGVSLKEICQVRNVDDIKGVPKFFLGYNGKPVLVTYSAKFIRTHAPRILEIGYDVRSWGYGLRSALPTVFEKSKSAQTDHALLVEGKAEEELPEQILCCGGFNGFDALNLPPVDAPAASP
ncbi:unnamed protein product [Amoebophrya sp. A25]|nr:unnamed protein product [Amoebophrya sp. A25]|eukprot:GSA25T00006782001.1